MEDSHNLKTKEIIESEDYMCESQSHHGLRSRKLYNTWNNIVTYRTLNAKPRQRNL